LEARLQALADNLLKNCAALRQQTLQTLWSSLAAARNRAQVIHAATHGADALIKRAREATWEELQKVSARIRPSVREEIATFEVCFRELYGAVAAPESFVADSDFPESVPNDWAGWIRPALIHVKQEQKHQSSQRAIGALLGGFLGFLVFLSVLDKGGCNSCSIALLALVASPFIGALIAGNKPSLVDALRRAYWSDLGPSIEAFFSQIDSMVLRHFKEAQRATNEQIDAALDHCLTRYDATIQDAIAKGESRIAEILRVERRINGDLADLERRRLDLQRVRNGLQQIQKL
jgi:hypothetical protein